MKLHERHVPVEEARRELMNFVFEWAKRHNLTLCEELALLSEELTRHLLLCVRHERREDA